MRGRPEDRSGRSGFGIRGGPFPMSLARVRSEELCSTRSEPDLRPMALDDYSCRSALIKQLKKKKNSFLKKFQTAPKDR